jgi:hypothetical protein
VLPNLYWFKGTEASPDASFLLAASFAQQYNLQGRRVVDAAAPRKQYEGGAAFTFTSTVNTQRLAHFIEKTLWIYKNQDGDDIDGSDDSDKSDDECCCMTEFYGLGRTWFASWSLDTSPTGAGHLLSLYITSKFPHKCGHAKINSLFPLGGSKNMRVPWLMKGIEVAVGGKVYNLDESGGGDRGFRKGRQLAVVDPLGLGSLPQEWSKKDWKAKGLPLKGKLEVKVTVRGMAHAGCKE